MNSAAPSTPQAQQGFTLVETMLALTLFTLILSISYQTLVATATARNRVLDEVTQQQFIRTAHRTLSQALSSQASLQGAAKHIEVDLANGDHPWLSGIERILFTLNDADQLVALLDDDTEPTLLLQGLAQGRFRYYSDGVTYSNWQESSAPQWVELSWQTDNQIRRMRFHTTHD